MSAASHAGRTSRARGLAWEAQLDAYHAQLRAQGRAVIVRVPTEAQVIGRTTQDARGRTGFRAVWAARTGVDFVGAVSTVHGPRPVFAEAKTCGADLTRWDFSASLDARTPGPQWVELRAASDVGGVALVLLDWGARGQWRWAWSELRALRDRGAASVTPEDCAARAVRIDGPRWLDEQQEVRR